MKNARTGKRADKARVISVGLVAINVQQMDGTNH